MNKLFLQIAFLVCYVIVSNEARLWDAHRRASYDVVAAHRRLEKSQNYELSPAINKVKLRVYYETLCPASVDFIVNELAPTVKVLGEFMDVQLIPYGHAKTRSLRGSLQFSCQHGPDECFGNKLHSCAIHSLNNSTRAVLFTACLLKYSVYNQYGIDFGTALNWCGYTQSISRRDIWVCAVSEKGSQLLRNHGESTHELNPPHVPYVTLDNSTTSEDQGAWQLSRKICSILTPAPPICDRYKQYQM